MENSDDEIPESTSMAELALAVHQPSEALGFLKLALEVDRHPCGNHLRTFYKLSRYIQHQYRDSYDCISVREAVDLFRAILMLVTPRLDELSPAHRVLGLTVSARCYHQITYFSNGEERQIAQQQAKQIFLRLQILTRDLLPALPEVLQAGLSFAEFLYEIESDLEEACEIAKRTFDNAIDNRIVELLSEEETKRATPVMKALRDKLTLWTQTGNANEDGEGGSSKG